MTTAKVSSGLRGVLLPAALGAVAAAVMACGSSGIVTVVGPPPVTTPPAGGGGGGSAATAYGLFASNYVAYSAKQADGAFLHSAEGGDVITGFSDTRNDGSTWNYGCFSYDQPTMNANQLYGLQIKANGIYTGATNTCTQPGAGAAPLTAADYAFIAIHAPGSGGTTPITPLDISLSTHLLIQMGNTYNPAFTGGLVGGNADVLTVELSDSPDGNASHAADDCRYDQTLHGVGAQIVSPLGVWNYAISLADPAWVCGPGTIGGLQATGVTAIVVKITGDKNPNVKFGELDVLAVGNIGFTKQVASLPVSAP